MVRQIAHHRRFPMRKNGFRRPGRYVAGSGSKLMVRTLVTGGRKVYDLTTKAKDIVDMTLQGKGMYDSYVGNNQEELKAKLIEFVLNSAINQYPPLKASQILFRLLKNPTFVNDLKNKNIKNLALKYSFNALVYASAGINL